METPYDALIIGGGPAGSTAATTLAKLGRKVLVVEREKFPRFHIGESLLPYSMEAFDRLGLRAKLDARFLPKHGGEIATACGNRAVKFYFKNGFQIAQARAYQVLRSEFDQLLLDHAAESGAEVREETTVRDLELKDDGATFTLTNGSETKASARFVIDASGRNSVIGTKLGLKASYADLQKFSVYAHYEAVAMEGNTCAEDTNLTRLIRGRDHWFWMIPVSATRFSVGIVMDTAAFKKLGREPGQVLEDQLRAQPLMRSRMAKAERVTPYGSAGDYSYRNTQLAGDRWLLAGDAAGFIDPIFSTGVFLAIMSGESAAKAVDTALTNPAVGARAFRIYARRVNKVMDMYLRFVRAWYRPEFIEVFTSPTERLQLASAINSVLAGNLGQSWAVRWRMWTFYTVVALQRRFALCPRLPATAPAL